MLRVTSSENGRAASDAEAVPGAPGAPALEVVVGDPSAEELAALVAVLSVVAQPTAAPAAEDPAGVRVDSWAAPWRGIGARVPLGPGAWSAGSTG